MATREITVSNPGLPHSRELDTDASETATLKAGLAVTGAVTASGGFTGDVTGNVTGGVTATAEVVSAANVITAAESGSVFFLNSATGFASTLPAPAAGLNFKFVISTIPTSGNTTVVTNGGANVIEGMADVNSTLVLAANEDSINFVASTCLIGDWVEVVSDGTSWFVSGQSGAAGGITFTVT